MRIITNQSINAFYNNTPFKSGNTSVCVLPDVTILSLHNNPIAYKYADGTLQITNCGWFSNTTKERLNALDGVNIRQCKGVWLLNGEAWDGKLITIK